MRVATTPATGARRPGLDALRGLAVALVILNHADPGVFGAAGMLGVTVFFTLSGYLITGLLLRDLTADGRVHYGQFFLARALRLLPPLLLVMLGYVVVEGIFDHADGRSLVPDTLLTGLTYTMNLPFMPHGSGSMYHLWTLATEEQFYLIWPVVLAWAWRRVDPLHRRRALIRVVGIGIAAALVLCVATMAYQWPDIARVYALPTSWASALLIGCGLRIGRDRAIGLLPAPTWARGLLGTVVVLSLLAGSVLPAQGGHPWTYLVTLPLIAFASGVLVLLADTAGPTLGRSPTIRLLAALGLVSYSAYLWNLPIQIWIGDPHTLAGGILGASLTLLAATLSWWLVERPLLRLRHRLREPAAVR